MQGRQTAWRVGNQAPLLPGGRWGHRGAGPWCWASTVLYVQLPDATAFQECLKLRRKHSDRHARCGTQLRGDIIAGVVPMSACVSGMRTPPIVAKPALPV